MITQPTGDGDHHNSDIPPFWREIISRGVCAIRPKGQKIKGSKALLMI